MSRRERAFFHLGEFAALVVGIVAALAWMWALGVLVTLAGLGVLYLLARSGALEQED
jgi:hypothetical protein